MADQRCFHWHVACRYPLFIDLSKLKRMQYTCSALHDFTIPSEFQWEAISNEPTPVFKKYVCLDFQQAFDSRSNIGSALKVSCFKGGI